MSDRASAFDRLYGATLLVLPRAFRSRFAGEMRDFAHDRMRAARQQGVRSELLEAARLLTDVLATFPTAWALLREERTRHLALGLAPYPRDHMDILLHDLRFALRSLIKRPAFFVVATLTLALGIGANTAIFSVINAVLIRALPYENPDQLVLVWGSQGKQKQQGVVYPDFLDWRSRNRTIAEMGVLRGQSVTMTGGETPERMIGSFVTAGLFRAVNTKMSQGRAFTDAETEVETKSPVALLQYEAWRARFGARDGILGQSVTLNGTTFTVVGVTAPNTQMPLGAPDVYLPVGYYPNAKGFDRGVRSMAVAARLKPGVTVEAAQEDLAAISADLANEYPATNAATGADVISLKEQTVGRVRASLYIILAAVTVVLLIACANVANLQLARGASRARELSVRAALGAGRGRIARQLLTENVLLSLFGGGAGILLALVLVKLLVALIGAQLPVDPTTISLDLPVLLFALLVSVGTGLLFGLIPAVQASRADLNDMLRSRTGVGHAGAATRNSLVVVQLALSLALLASAGLLTRSLTALQNVNPGWDGSNLLTAQFRLPVTTYDTPEKMWGMFERTIAELRATPGVQSAALVRASPLSGNGESLPITVDGRPAVAVGDMPQMQVNIVTTGYFATMKIPVIAGHDIAETDRAGAPAVMLVNKSFAEATWPGESALGKRLKIGADEWRTIVGVVGDTKHYSLNEPQLLQGYIPHAQRPQVFTSLVVRTVGNPNDMVKPVRDAIWRVDNDQPVWRFRAMTEDLSAVVASPKAMMWLTGVFALVALLVAAVGIYGVLSYTMAQRTQEIGIRIALGADRSTVTGMVVREGAKLVGMAVVAGLLASVGAARLLRSQLFGVQPNDLVTFGVVTVVLSSVAIVACWIPARRASRVDPMEALRME